MLWAAWSLALLLALGNAMAAATPMRMLAMTQTVDMSGMHHMAGTMAEAVSMAVPAHVMAAMPHDHQGAAALMSRDEPATDPAPHGIGCPCCDEAHCSCLQACNPLPQIAAALTVAPLPVVVMLAPLRVVATISIVDSPPLRPPIA